MNPLVAQISPSFLSSDLFHPGWVKQRNVLTAGVSSRNWGKHWGNDSSRYGEIGKLPALKTSTEYDILNSRSHRHYSSGIHSFEVSSHPYVITEISSVDDKTISDELRSIDKQLVPDHLVQSAYTSHISRFEVFPRFHPGRSEHDAPTRRTLEQDIGPATQNALEELSSIYRETEYQKNYKPPTTVENAPIITTLPEIEYLVQLQENEMNDKQDGKEMKNKQDPEEEEEECDTKKRSDSNSSETNQEVILTNAGNAVMPMIASKPTSGELAVQRPTHGDSLTQPTKPSLRRLGKRRVNHHLDTSPSDCRARHNISLLLPKVTGYGKKKAFDASKVITLPRMPGIPTSAGAYHRDVRLPSIRFMYDDILHRKQFNSLTKPRLPEMVGMKFKSDAHVKYHINHPELIPDFRESITDGKQHFFYGVHMSLLR